MMKRFKEAWNAFKTFPVEYIMGVTMALMGVAIVAFPSRGTVGFMLTTYGVHAEVFGLILVLCALVDMTRPRPEIFILTTFPFLLYVVCSFIFFLSTPDVSPVFVTVYLGFYVLTVRLYHHVGDEPNVH